MKPPKIVVFDIGNVLLKWDPNQLYEKLIPDAGARKDFFEETQIEAMNDLVDEGAPFKETVYALADQHPKHAELIRAWHDRWLDMASPEIVGTSELLRRLKAQGTPVYALSNFGVETYAFAQTVYPILHEFDRQYISGHLKCIKPGPEIYEKLEEDSGYFGSDLVFFDDREDNIAAARARGWHGYVFENAEKMIEDLISVGILGHN